jgi:aryl-alcohol dehydrogenase-like predicted oxidoreductase
MRNKNACLAAENERSHGGKRVVTVRRIQTLTLPAPHRLLLSLYSVLRMERRQLGSTGMGLSAVGLGTWNVGPVWDDVSDEQAREAIRTALSEGANFVDTAEVYGEGRAERLIADVLSERPASAERVYVATKAAPDEDERHSAAGLRDSVAGSQARLGVEQLDLLQLHCPETAAFYEPETFAVLETLKRAGEIAHAGVSVEKVEEAMKAIEYDVIESVQIIFNPFRQRPAARFFERAAAEDVGVIVRVPLASGLLADAFDGIEDFGPDDHRRTAAEEGVTAGVGREGGETFAGVPFDTGLEAVGDLRRLVPDDATMAQFTLRWILDFDAVTTVIPGSTTPSHVAENVAATDLSPLSHETHGAVRDVYEAHLYDAVHHRW